MNYLFLFPLLFIVVTSYTDNLKAPDSQCSFLVEAKNGSGMKHVGKELFWIEQDGLWRTEISSGERDLIYRSTFGRITGFEFFANKIYISTDGGHILKFTRETGDESAVAATKLPIEQMHLHDSTLFFITRMQPAASGTVSLILRLMLNSNVIDTIVRYIEHIEDFIVTKGDIYFVSNVSTVIQETVYPDEPYGRPQNRLQWSCVKFNNYKQEYRKLHTSSDMITLKACSDEVFILDDSQVFQTARNKIAPVKSTIAGHVIAVSDLWFISVTSGKKVTAVKRDTGVRRELFTLEKTCSTTNALISNDSCFVQCDNRIYLCRLPLQR